MLDWIAHLQGWKQDVFLYGAAVFCVVSLALLIYDSMRRVTFFHEEIACAAIKYPDIGVLALPAPARHHHVKWVRLFIDGRESHGDAEQGFLTTTGRFVDRQQGWKIAEKRGQIEQISGNPGTLYSEDMWPETPPEARDYYVAKVGEDA